MIPLWLQLLLILPALGVGLYAFLRPCQIAGHDWEWGLGPCMNCGAQNPNDPTR